MTSNIGSPVIQEFYAGNRGSVKDEAELERVVKMELKTNFRPEFLNRVDDIIIFHSLSEAQIGEIVDVQLRQVAARLAEQKVTLELTPGAKRLIAKEGYDPQFGARPLKRTIQDLVLNPLATKLLKGEVKPGDRLKAVAQSGELWFEQA
jgi:ATP-dependent Clp protease ATP-binding subunit ClpA